MSTKTKIAAPMTKNFTIFKQLGLLMMVMALSAPVVYADNTAAPNPSHHEEDWHHGQQDHIMAKVLNLSDDQVKQLKDSREKNKEAMKSIFEQMKSNREAFNAEIVKATPDMSKINGIETQIKTLQSQMVDNHLNSILEIKKILTPEQFAGYMALENARKMMGHHDGQKHWGDKPDRGHDSQD
jgi:Spy/CpxP family protein refolding chaperone